MEGFSVGRHRHKMSPEEREAFRSVFTVSIGSEGISVVVGCSLPSTTGWGSPNKTLERTTVESDCLASQIIGGRRSALR